MITMIKLIVFLSILSVAIGFQSPSTISSINLPPDDLLEDLRKIAEQITGDPENLDKLTRQLKQISANNQNLVKAIENQMVTSKPNTEKATSESSQPGTNPSAIIQGPLNTLLESMQQLFANMRQLFERIPVPDNADLNPLKALQSLESQFQTMMNGLRISNPLLGTSQSTDHHPTSN